jgi:hypothetical protein
LNTGWWINSISPIVLCFWLFHKYCTFENKHKWNFNRLKRIFITFKITTCSLIFTSPKNIFNKIYFRTTILQFLQTAYIEMLIRIWSMYGQWKVKLFRQSW